MVNMPTAPTVAFGRHALEQARINRSHARAYSSMYQGPVPPPTTTPTPAAARRAALADRIMGAGTPLPADVEQ